MSRYTLLNVDHIAKAARLPRAQTIAYFHIVSLCNNNEKGHRYRGIDLRKGQFMTTGVSVAKVVRDAGEYLPSYRPGVKILKALEKEKLVALHRIRYGELGRSRTIVTVLGVHGAPTFAPKIAETNSERAERAIPAPAPAPKAPITAPKESTPEPWHYDEEQRLDDIL